VDSVAAFSRRAMSSSAFCFALFSGALGALASVTSGGIHLRAAYIPDQSDPSDFRCGEAVAATPAEAASRVADALLGNPDPS
jgi:hypothetical protein